MSTDEKSIAEIIRFYQNDELLKYELEGFKKQVENFFFGLAGFCCESEVSNSFYKVKN